MSKTAVGDNQPMTARAPRVSTASSAAVSVLVAVVVTATGCLVPFDENEGQGECGDGIVDQGEVCDDGNTFDGDDCRSDCGQDYTVCGDSNTQPSRGETCDDGNRIDGDGCSANCQDEVCGAENCAQGCCNDFGGCEPGVLDVSCGAEGHQCQDCTLTGSFCIDQLCQILPSCEPGEEVECGYCGKRTCDPTGQWGNCENQGVCARDTVQDGVMCEYCGYERRTCTTECQWTDWDCVEQGVCQPGFIETITCGTNGCGTQTRQCQSDCLWGTWGACTGDVLVTVTLTAYDGQQRHHTDCESSVFVLDYPTLFSADCPGARCRWELGKGGVRAYVRDSSDCATVEDGFYAPMGACSTANAGTSTVTCCAH